MDSESHTHRNHSALILSYRVQYLINTELIRLRSKHFDRIESSVCFVCIQIITMHVQPAYEMIFMTMSFFGRLFYVVIPCRYEC